MKLGLSHATVILRKVKVITSDNKLYSEAVITKEIKFGKNTSWTSDCCKRLLVRRSPDGTMGNHHVNEAIQNNELCLDSLWTLHNSYFHQSLSL